MRRAAFVVMVLLASDLLAQETTGTIAGTVLDDSGRVIARVRATLRSRQSIRGALTAETSERGTFRFSALTPGDYELVVDGAGFETYREDRIQLLAGRSVERRVFLPLARHAEHVVVKAERIERDVVEGTVYGRDLVENLPRLRSDSQEFLLMATGASPTFPRGATNVSAFGSNTGDHAFLVDGADRTDAFSGIIPPFVGADQIESVEISTSGVSAEYGNFQGAVVNVLTRQGSEDWRFDASYFLQNEAFTSKALRVDCECPSGETSFERDRRQEVTVNAGGPLLPRRLWFFGGYGYAKEERSGPGNDPRFVPEESNQRYMGKLGWDASARTRISGTFQGGNLRLPELPSIEVPLETLVLTAVRMPSLAVSLQHILSSDSLFEARFGGNFRTDENVPNSGHSLPFHFDVMTGRASGGSWTFGESRANRVPAAVKLTHYAEEFLSSNHEMKFGVQLNLASFRHTQGRPGGVWYYDYGGAPYLASFQEPNPGTDATEVRNVGIFAEDSIRVGSRATLHLGLRYDRSRTASVDAPAIDAEGSERGTVEGLGTLFTWTRFSPRFGLTFALDEQASTLVRASWGRYVQASANVDFQRFHPGGSSYVLAAYDEADGAYTDVLSVFDSRGDRAWDAALSPPRTDILSLGFERRLATWGVVTARYLHKSQKNATGWVDATGVYGIDTATLPDGREITVFPLLSDPSERSYELTNPLGWYLTSDGLHATWEARWRHVRMLSSYSFSRTVGIEASSPSSPGTPQFSFSGVTRSDPNRFINAEGEMPNDRTHLLRVQAVGEVPKLDLVVGAHFQYLSGVPWAATAWVRLPQGPLSVFIEPRGTRRLPAYTLLDLRLSKIFRIGSARRVELFVDIFDVFNNPTPGEVRSTDLFSPGFGEGRSFSGPRRAMLGGKVQF